jgi:hypothetical protein
VHDLNELTDVNGRPMALDRMFTLEAEGSNEVNVRVVGLGSNKRQIIFKDHDIMYLTLDKRFMKNTHKAFGINGPGTDDWLLGNLAASNDVTLGKNQLSSQWFFANESTDSCGEKCYEIWSKRTDIVGGGDVPIFLPVDSLARAGYDKDHEWRTYSGGVGAPNGFFKVKFQLVEWESGEGQPKRTPRGGFA